jgi:hypothetical protein
MGMKRLTIRTALAFAVVFVVFNVVQAQTPQPENTPLPEGVYSLSGQILEKGNKAPVLGGSLFLEAVANTVEAESVPTPVPISADADLKGHYQISAPAGTYQLIVAGEGFKKITLASFSMSKNLEKNFFLERDGFTLPEVLVSTDKVSQT